MLSTINSNELVRKICVYYQFEKKNFWKIKIKASVLFKYFIVAYAKIRYFYMENTKLFLKSFW